MTIARYYARYAVEGRAILEALIDPTTGLSSPKRWIAIWDGAYWFCYDRDDDHFLGIRAVAAEASSPRRKPFVTVRKPWATWAA